jgi:Kef-type K+ transport system membrane component KefB
MSSPPIAAASGAQHALVALFVVLLAAKLGEEVFRRLGQPPIVGEILAGIVVGPSALGLVEPSAVLETFSELGVVLLLFVVGLESRLADMRAVGGRALRVGLLGVIVPFAGGLALGEGLGEDLQTSLFLGAALMATSAGITSAVLLDLGAGDRDSTRTILGAAVVDDVVALLLLSVVFIGVVAVGGSRLLARYPAALKAPAFTQTGLLPAVLLCLGLAAVAAEIGLAAIIGAFLAGMVVAETKEHTEVEASVQPLYAFFAPFFFAFIGLQVDLAALVEPSALALLAAVTALAVVTKLVGCWPGARGLPTRERALVAVGMIPRGEVGIVVASLGAGAGVIDGELFAVIVGMAVLTTLAAPPVLRRLV